MRINKKLVKPMVETERYSEEEFVDMRFLPIAIIFSIIAVIVAILLGILAYDTAKWLLRKPGPPPKVITKVVKQDALTAEQQKFISDCEKNSDQQGDHYIQAVPDIHTGTWTCKMP